jgi:hypothetical protein
LALSKAPKALVQKWESFLDESSSNYIRAADTGRTTYALDNDIKVPYLSRPCLICSGSIADPGCLSRIPDPDFYPFQIPDLGSRIQKQQQMRGIKKKLVVKPFFVAINFTKLKKFGPDFKEL